MRTQDCTIQINSPFLQDGGLLSPAVAAKRNLVPLYEKVIVTIASYYKHLSADSKIKKYKINSSFVGLWGRIHDPTKIVKKIGFLYCYSLKNCQ